MKALMHSLDLALLTACNALRGRHPRFDELVDLVTQNDLVKFGLVVAALWWFWTQPGADLRRRREIVLCTLVATIAAAGVGRLVSHVLVLHVRPEFTPGLELAHAFPRIASEKVSSFPSDHAAMAFALVAGLLALSRAAGLGFAVYAVVLVCFPRVYTGLHWPSDLVGGALLGFALGKAMTSAWVRSAIARPALAAVDRWPGPAYAVLFLVSLGLVTRFDNVRDLGRWAAGKPALAKTIVER